MPNINFLQIHSLHGYPASLLNRDDSGLAKRITYGGKMRTRISSQCLKRHWRVTHDVNSVEGIDGATAAVRSRETVTRRVIEPLRNARHNPEVIDAVEAVFQTAVYGKKAESRSGRQPLLLGDPEIEYLANNARVIVEAHANNPEEAQKAAEDWAKSVKLNMKELRNSCQLPGGFISALFGRMVTSDVGANLDAAIHVAHAFTVHGEESESDYFTVVDDLHRAEDDAGADHIGETELTSGLFYGYVVIDRRTLLCNLSGDQQMAHEVTKRLIHLIATVSPGAKLGSTAPYGYASWLLVEAGDRQPRSLAEAFREPCAPQIEKAEASMGNYISKIDAVYGAGEVRRSMSLSNTAVPGADPLSLPELAAWSGAVMQKGDA